jgi:hypothetical protein
MPVTIPVAEPTVAIAGLPLIQLPPVDELDNVVVKPAQTLKVPELEPELLTVTVVLVAQPVLGLVYTISVEPMPIGVRTPEVASIMATS